MNTKYGERWYQRIWRPSIAFLYISLNVMDYIVRPLINFYYMKTMNITEILLSIRDLDPAVQMKLLDNISNSVLPPILPEFVHIAFGAILGVAAYARGAEKGWLVGSPVYGGMDGSSKSDARHV